MGAGRIDASWLDRVRCRQMPKRPDAVGVSRHEIRNCRRTGTRRSVRRHSTEESLPSIHAAVQRQHARLARVQIMQVHDGRNRARRAAITARSTTSMIRSKRTGRVDTDQPDAPRRHVPHEDVRPVVRIVRDPVGALGNERHVAAIVAHRTEIEARTPDGDWRSGFGVSGDRSSTHNLQPQAKAARPP